MYCVLPTIRSMRVKFLIGVLILLSVYMFLFYIMIQMWTDRKTFPVTVSSLVLPNVVVHIDLKGSPPKLKYLESLLPLLKDHGVTGLLMEYEDMFPYEGKLKNISSRNCYGRTELRNFLKAAANSDLEIIPLVQTFGHMEHVLKLQEFMHLRELAAYPDSLCPSKTESRLVVKNMLQQVMSFHNAIMPLQHIHVGCDEVYHINKCAQCTARVMNEKDIYAEHVTFLSEYVKEISPQTSVLIWDDMLRTIGLQKWGNISLAKDLQPVYWDYISKPTVSHVSLLQYHKALGGIWIASAFKGADGREATIPDLHTRYHNHFNWMKIVKDYRFGGERAVYNFQGIILTGWSRYSHFEQPCELLPAAIPSLILNLLLIRKFKTGVAFFLLDNGADSFGQYLYDDLSYSLKCHSRVGLGRQFHKCGFKSSQLYEIFEHFELLKRSIGDVLSGPMSSIEYYASKRFLNPNLVKEHIKWCNFTLNELINIKILMSHFMEPYYERHVIDEYVSFKTYSYKKSLRSWLKKFKIYSRKRVWERNPFNATF